MPVTTTRLVKASIPSSRVFSMLGFEVADLLSGGYSLQLGIFLEQTDPEVLCGVNGVAVRL